MQLVDWAEVTLILTLAFVSENLGHENWTISIKRTISEARGSDATIPCKFDCPECDGEVSVIWKKRIGNSLDKGPNGKNEFVYHEQKENVLERYRNKTELVKNGTKDCSLRIKNVTFNDQDIYVRLKTEKSEYSFYTETVSIFVREVNISNSRTPSPGAETTMATNPKISSASMYTAIFVPVAALVIIVILAGTFCFVKRKRKQSFTREGSGYYANFSRASSNNVKSELSCKKIDNMPEISEVEDPVYVNAKHSLDQIDNTNNIYANVNYSR